VQRSVKQRSKPTPTAALHSAIHHFGKSAKSRKELSVSSKAAKKELLIDPEVSDAAMVRCLEDAFKAALTSKSST